MHLSQFSHQNVAATAAFCALTGVRVPAGAALPALQQGGSAQDCANLK